MRRSIRYAFWALGCLVSLLGAALVWLSWEMRTRPPDAALPPLVRNLPRETLKRTAAFRERVRARFRDGVRTDALAAELVREGFQLQQSPKENLELATAEQRSWVCTEGWIIFWKPDREGRAREIDALDNLGCL